MYCWTPFPLFTKATVGKNFYSIGKLHDPAAARQLFVVVTALRGVAECEAGSLYLWSDSEVRFFFAVNALRYLLAQVGP